MFDRQRENEKSIIPLKRKKLKTKKLNGRRRNRQGQDPLFFPEQKAFAAQLLQEIVQGLGLNGGKLESHLFLVTDCLAKDRWP